MNKKYLIAPTQRIGFYWARQMELRRDEINIITDEEHMRGIRFNMENTIYVETEVFDNPEYTLSLIQQRKFEHLCSEVESEIKRRQE